MFKNKLLEIIANGENSGVEFKRDDIKPEQLAKEIVALANLKGGYILLGVEDDGTISGISRKNLSEWVADTVFGRYVHPLILPYYEEILMDDNKRIALITIEEEFSKPYVVRANDRETAYVRIGNVSRPATREQFGRLCSMSGMIHVEIMPVSRTSFKSLDKARLDNYLRDILNDPEVPETEEAWITRLKALGFMTEGIANQPVCTIAGLVLFGIKPRQILKQAGLRLLFFDSHDKEYRAQLDKILDAPMVGRFQMGESGKHLIDTGLIEKCLELIEPFITEEPDEIDKNFRRVTRWFYPYEAIRELIINALAHRDWTRFVDIEISGYKDRLEIISPGALPNSMTLEKMLAGQRSARNNIIVEVLKDYGYVDARGMGVRTKVLPAMKATGMKFVFDTTEDYVKSILTKIKDQTIPKNDPLTDKLTVYAQNDVGKTSGKVSNNVGKEETALNTDKTIISGKQKVGKTSGKIIKIIRNRETITIPELANLIGVTERSVERNIRKLQSEGFLKRIGGRKQGHWEVI